MILTCPSCEARFNIKPEALLPSGRSVRCSKCAHTWKELPPEDMPKRVIEEEPTPMVPVPDTFDSDPDYEDVREEADDDPDDVEVPSLESIEEAASNEDEFELPAFTPRTRSRRQQREAKSKGPMLMWGAIVAVLAIVFGGGFFGRAAIIDVWPPASMIYGMVGLAPGPGFGLELRNVAPKQKVEGDTAVLVISGEVVNISSRLRNVPTLQGSLLDAGQNEIHSWTFSMAPEELAPGESGTFSTRVPNPPEGARGLEVTFVDGQEG